MTDSEIVNGLINRDDKITARLFFIDARPLLQAIIRRVFDIPPCYDEIVNELYAYLVDNDCAKLRQFGFESSFLAWLKVVATRYFLRYRENIVEDKGHEDMPPSAEPAENPADDADARLDIATLLGQMGNARYEMVIRRLVIAEVPPGDLALEMGITVDNLYNIKRRALATLSRLALKAKMRV